MHVCMVEDGGITPRPLEKPGEILFLSKTDVERVLTFREVLDICDKVFKWVGEGKVKQKKTEPLNIERMDTPTGKFVTSFLAYIEPLAIGGTKWTPGARANPSKGLPYIPATVILNDGETMLPIAVMDGVSITSMRTAGHAGVGAKYLAKKGSSVIAIIGCGLEGKTHLMMMNENFKIKEVRIFDLKKDVMDKFAKEMGKTLKLNIRSFNTAKDAVKGADVVCMVTTANQPVVLDEWIEPGCHIAGTAQFRDIDPKLSKTVDKWVLGNWELDLQWFERPGHWAGKLSKKDVYADLSELATGKKHGRESDEERTLMTHGGMGALDVAAAHAAYEAAKKRGIGTKISLF